jgi:hypothetical protein
MSTPGKAHISDTSVAMPASSPEVPTSGEANTGRFLIPFLGQSHNRSADLNDPLPEEQAEELAVYFALSRPKFEPCYLPTPLRITSLIDLKIANRHAVTCCAMILGTL